MKWVLPTVGGDGPAMAALLPSFPFFSGELEERKGREVQGYGPKVFGKGVCWWWVMTSGGGAAATADSGGSLRQRSEKVTKESGVGLSLMDYSDQ